MRISIEIDGTTFTLQPVQPTAGASGAALTANAAAAVAAAGTTGTGGLPKDVSAGVSKTASADAREDTAARDDLFARAAALGALDGGPAPSGIEQEAQPSPERWVGASVANTGDDAISAGPA